MKAIAKTSQSIMLVDPQTREILTHDKPSVVTWTQFLEARTGKGQIKILASDLPTEASDTEFQKFLAEADGKEDLAVEAYLSTFAEENEKPKPAAKKPAAKKPAAKAED
ncbi:hypothetical protein MHM88_14395 [Epibacterium sp. MM17-32]|uniref:hypothetical protein n=1 Tax=Epibacterium sp. MM17-32 TaxID=2917734 RepID=UPI001EF438E6|nr:hypothetical protein [Epibacterium sp. MM17-32]MCG7628998.1 hypothetical protein [Epibacterium sp. MM17-32]